MAQYKTPGVYVVEKNAFPNTVVEVETAVPAFIGYTEKAERNKESLINKPTRITTFAEYHASFGGAPHPRYDLVSNGHVKLKTPQDQFMLYQCLRMFFANGGGPCYIVSVGTYASAKSDGGIQEGKLIGGLPPLVKEPEPTMVVVPDAVLLGKGNGDPKGYPDDPQSCHDVYNAVLMHCQKMQSRVGIFDVYNGHLDRDDNHYNRDVIDDFRNGVQQALNYGAAYYPWVNASVVEDNEVDYTYLKPEAIKTLQEMMQAEIEELYPNPRDPKRESIEAKIKDLASPPTLSDLTKVVPGSVSAEIMAQSEQTAKSAALKDALENYKKTLVSYEKALGIDPTTAGDLDATQEALDGKAGELDGAAKTKLDGLADEVNTAKEGFEADPPTVSEADYQKAADALANTEKKVKRAQDDVAAAQGKVAAATAAQTKAGEAFDESKTTAGNDIQAVKEKLAEEEPPPSVNATSLHLSLLAVSGAYKTVIQALKKEMNVLPPAAAMAGVYTRIDNTIGVFKAPANTGIVAVASPTVNITHDDQEELNVPLNGKAINALRTFPGYGTLVWGARTLDGNSQDWRYINVRRTLIMLEQSIKAAMQAYVFEPNVAATWSLVSSTISSFLTNQWKAGALAGASPADAFDVSVGLGSTMTGDDILDGYMRVTIRVAIVRPAEFIVLTFQQKMQTS